MKLLQFLVAMQRDVGCVNIQNQLFGWCFMGRNKLVYQHSIQGPEFFAGDAGFHSGKSRRTGQLLIAANGSLEQWIMTQLVVIVEIFVPAAQPVKPLSHKVTHAMSGLLRVSRIMQSTCRSV